jgi:hypothetical protein
MATLKDGTIVSGTTDSSSKDTGALIVEGGVGIEKNLYVGGKIDGTIEGVNRDGGTKQGMCVYAARVGTTLDINCIPSGVLNIQPGRIEIGGKTLVSAAMGTLSQGLTAGHWQLVYVDVAGTITYEEMTATTYGILPLPEIDTKAPLDTYATARYKSGDATKRLLACVYAMPDKDAYAAGTTYTKGMMCSTGGKIYIYKYATGASGKNPATETSYWHEMGATGAVFAPMVFNFPEPLFGHGAMGDITLANADIITVGYDYTDTTWRNLPYFWKNVTLEASAVVHIGQSTSSTLTIPGAVDIKVKGTLLFNSASRLDGNGKGITGGAGGTGGGGAGGAGANSGYPLDLYVSNVVDLTATNAFVINNAPGVGSDGGAGGGVTSGGGGGGASTSGLRLVYKNFRNLFNGNVGTTSILPNKIKTIVPLYLSGNEAGGTALANFNSGRNGVGYGGGGAGGGVDNAGIGSGQRGSGTFGGGSGGACGATWSSGGGGGGITGGGAGGAGGGIGVGGAAGGKLGGGGGGLGAGGGSGSNYFTPSSNPGSAPAQPHTQAGGYFVIQQVGNILDELMI